MVMKYYLWKLTQPLIVDEPAVTATGVLQGAAPPRAQDHADPPILPDLGGNLFGGGDLFVSYG